MGRGPSLLSAKVLAVNMPGSFVQGWEVWEVSVAARHVQQMDEDPGRQDKEEIRAHGDVEEIPAQEGREGWLPGAGAPDEWHTPSASRGLHAFA